MQVNEQLALLTAIKKAVDKRIKEVREEADDMFTEAFDADGIEKVALKVGGEKVGEFTATYNSEYYTVDDMDAFADFALSNGLAEIREFIRPGMEQASIGALEVALPPEVFGQYVGSEVKLVSDWDRYFEHVGDAVVISGTSEVVPGVSYHPRKYKGTRVTGCNPQDVLPILNQLPGGVGLLLGDGGE